MYKLFLDDERTPAQVKWIELPLGPYEIVRNYADFVTILRKRGLPVFVTFGHDLADDHYKVITHENATLRIPYKDYTEKTGYECAKFLVDYCIETSSPIPPFMVHSLNHIGKENINKLLNGYKKFIGQKD